MEMANFELQEFKSNQKKRKAVWKYSAGLTDTVYVEIDYTENNNKYSIEIRQEKQKEFKLKMETNAEPTKNLLPELSPAKLIIGINLPDRADWAELRTWLDELTETAYFLKENEAYIELLSMGKTA